MHPKFQNAALALIIASIGWSEVHAGTLIRTETFDTAPGWVGLRNADLTIGNDFGFRGSNYTGGSSPAGEAGGTIARTLEVSFYADTDLGGSLTLADHIQASGELDFTSVGAFNNGIRIGHRNTSAASTDATIDNFLGLEFAENHGAGYRIRAVAVLDDGGTIGGAEILGLIQNGDYSWITTYTPDFGMGLLVVEVFSSGVSLGTSTVGLSASQRLVGAYFDAFGIGSGGLTPPENNPQNTVDIFIDNVSYSTAIAVDEPLSAGWISLGALALFLRRQRSVFRTAGTVLR
jgi:hypothetical protein